MLFYLRVERRASRPQTPRPLPAGEGALRRLLTACRDAPATCGSACGRSNGFPDGVPLAQRDISLQALGAKTLGSLSITFAGLRPGAYAVCAFHDRDGSGKLTQNFLGIPQEEWGMSGNPRPRYRTPRFGEAKIGLNAREEKTISITLHT